MSKESRQHLREAAKQRKRGFARRRIYLLLFPLIAAALVAVGTFVWVHSHPQKPGIISTAESSSFKQPGTLTELLALPTAELEHCDIARLNLLCAEGLPGAGNCNMDKDLAIKGSVPILRQT